MSPDVGAVEHEGTMDSFITVITDDHPRLNGILLLAQMPWVKANMIDQGVQFTDFTANQPRCGPNRACLDTAQTPEFHHINDNDVAGVGDSFVPTNTIAKLLKDDGYSTGRIGKHNNLYGERRDHPFHNRVPGETAVFTYFFCWTSPGPSYLENKFREGVIGHDGSAAEILTYDNTNNPDPSDGTSSYSTKVLKDKAIAYINATNLANPNQPIHLTISVHAPHGPLTATDIEGPYKSGGSAGYVCTAGSYGCAGCPPGSCSSFPTYNKFSSDDPQFIKDLGCFNGSAAYDLCLIERALQSVDDLIESVMTQMITLGYNSGSNRTWLFFTTDNSNAYGEKRLDGKGMPYDTGTNVHFLAYSPGNMGAVPRTVTAPYSSIDLPKTITDLAEVTIPYVHQGTSFKHELLGDGLGTPPATTYIQQSIPRNDEIIPVFDGIKKSNGDVFWEYYRESSGTETDLKGLYLAADTWQENNRVGEGLALQTEMESLLAARRGTLAQRPHSEVKAFEEFVSGSNSQIVCDAQNDVEAGRVVLIGVTCSGTANVTDLLGPFTDSVGNVYTVVPGKRRTVNEQCYVLRGEIETPLVALTTTLTLIFTDSAGTPVLTTNRRVMGRAFLDVGDFHDFSVTAGTSDKPIGNSVEVPANGVLYAVCNYAVGGGTAQEGSGYLLRGNYTSTGRRAFAIEAIPYALGEYIPRATLDGGSVAWEMLATSFNSTIGSDEPGEGTMSGSGRPPGHRRRRQLLTRGLV